MVMMVADTYLPVSLSVPGMTDAQFEELCEQYADYRLEYTAEGELIILPPTDAETSSRNAMIVYLLMKWALEQGRGTVTDSSGGFVLPNGARLAPDAAWISRERFRRKPICPRVCYRVDVSFGSAQKGSRKDAPLGGKRRGTGLAD